MNITIKATNFDLVPSVENAVLKKLGAVEKFIPKNTQPVELRVEIALDTRHHRKGSIYRAEANLSIHGDLMRVEAVGKNPFSAIIAVKEKLAEEVKQYKNKQASREKRRSGKIGQI